MLPGHKAPIRSQAGLNAVVSSMAEVSPANVVLARPHHFDRRLHSFGDLHGFSNKMAVRHGTTPKASAEQRGV